jgi:hypothetical protein
MTLRDAELLPAAEIAAHCGVEVPTVHRWVREKKVRRAGGLGKAMIYRQSVLDFLGSPNPTRQHVLRKAKKKAPP